MKGLKLKWPGPGRLRRSVLTLGVAGATAGGVLLAAAPAYALVGTDPTPGTIVLSQMSGPVTNTPTWTTTDGCPTGTQTSAELKAVDFGSTTNFTSASAPLNLSGGNPISTPQGLLDTVGNILSAAGVPNGGSDEWVVACASQNSDLGTIVNYQNLIITLSADGTTYTASTPAPADNTSTVVSAVPGPSTSVGTPVMLTATVSDTSHPNTAVAGSVVFKDGATVLNTTAANVTCTTATPPVCTATFNVAAGFTASGTQNITAVFTPTNTTAFNGSTSAIFQEIVAASGTQTAGTVPVSVTITQSGSLTVTVPTATAVLTLNTAGTLATGNLGTVTVSETDNSFPGFAVYGQETANFTDAPHTPIPSDNLGWTPAGTVQGGAALGPSAADIGANVSPAVLVFAHAGTGFGTDLVNPALSLTIPVGTSIGTYTGGVTITYVASFA